MSLKMYLLLFFFVLILSIVIALVITHRVSKKELESDISLEQMNYLENQIMEFYKNNQLNPGASIWDIALKLKVVAGGTNKELSDEAQLSSPDNDGNMTVTFKSGLSRESMHFAFAHECAHIVNKDKVPVTRPIGDNKPLIEQLADYTAAALLMPVDKIYQYLEENNYRELSSKKRMQIVRNLCEQYTINRVIAMRRIKEVYELKRCQHNI